MFNHFRLKEGKKVRRFPCRPQDGSKIIPLKFILTNQLVQGSCQLIHTQKGIQRHFTFICENCKEDIAYQSVPFDMY